MSAAEITTRAVPVSVFRQPTTNPTFPGFRLMAKVRRRSGPARLHVPTSREIW